MEKEEGAKGGFTEVFLSKLKEQSFTIVLMIGVVWYQGRMMEERVAYWQKLYEESKDYIQQTTKDDREELLERINYLQDQRDKYVEDAINELKTN